MNLLDLYQKCACVHTRVPKIVICNHLYAWSSQCYLLVYFPNGAWQLSELI